MNTLGFFHFVYDNKKATEFAIKSAREHYPDSYYVLIGDGGVDHYDLAKKYNCDYFHFNKNMGYGSLPVQNVLMILQRILMACIRTDTTHLMMMEDDVVILDKIDIPEGTYCMGQPIGVQNKIEPSVLELLEHLSGVKPETDYYCFGGGSILEVKTFVENYPKVCEIYHRMLEIIKARYQQIGWVDCFLTVFYYLSGKPITLHQSLHTVAPWPQDVRDFDLNTVRGKCSIVDRYKNNYK